MVSLHVITNVCKGESSHDVRTTNTIKAEILTNKTLNGIKIHTLKAEILTNKTLNGIKILTMFVPRTLLKLKY